MATVKCDHVIVRDIQSAGNLLPQQASHQRSFVNTPRLRQLLPLTSRWDEYQAVAAALEAVVVVLEAAEVAEAAAVAARKLLAVQALVSNSSNFYADFY